MTLFTLIISNLRFKPLAALFNILLLGMGISMILTLSHLDRQLSDRMAKDLKGIDLVISGKGSPLQIILSTLFHLDIPTGNITAEEASTLAKNPLIKSAIPMALGDNFQGFRIIGTTNAYIDHYGGKFAQGHNAMNSMEAVLGSEAARVSGVNIGDKIVGAHGLVNSDDLHTDFPYTVTGILAPTGTVIDRVVITPIESVWHVHEHPDADDPEEVIHKQEHPENELTALLVTYKSPLAAAQLPRLINKDSSMQAASPAFEVARLTRLMGTGSEFLSAFGVILIGFSAFGFFVTLNTAINDRLHDIALMRVLGATRKTIFGLIVSEAMLLGVLGSILGSVLALVFQAGATWYVETTHHMTLPPTGISAQDMWIISLALALSLLSAILPAIRAYRLMIPRTLSRLS